MASDKPEKKDTFGSSKRQSYRDSTIDELFESHTPFGRSETGFLAGKSFNVAANIYESPIGLVITIDCPGIQPEDFDLKLEGTRLIVSGKRDFVKDYQDEEFVRLERGFGSFRRIFEMPEGVDGTAVSAKLENGVLKIIVPLMQKRRDIVIESDG